MIEFILERWERKLGTVGDNHFEDSETSSGRRSFYREGLVRDDKRI